MSKTCLNSSNRLVMADDCCTRGSGEEQDTICNTNPFLTRGLKNWSPSLRTRVEDFKPSSSTNLFW